MSAVIDIVNQASVIHDGTSQGINKWYSDWIGIKSGYVYLEICICNFLGITVKFKVFIKFDSNLLNVCLNVFYSCDYIHTHNLFIYFKVGLLRANIKGYFVLKDKYSENDVHNYCCLNYFNVFSLHIYKYI